MKTVVITGANRGIGLALTETFLREGWRVIAVARSAPNIKPMETLQFEQCDVADGAALKALAKKLEGTAVDVLINNAGVYDTSGVGDEDVIDDITALTHVFAVNTVAPKLLAELLVPNLQAGQDKLVVAISSGMGTYSEFDDYHAKHWAYSASKTALNYAMVSFAKLHQDLKATLINPGWVHTRMGGSDAPLKPEESADAIFDLIANHEDKLPDGQMVDYEGKHMDF